MPCSYELIIILINNNRAAANLDPSTLQRLNVALLSGKEKSTVSVESHLRIGQGIFTISTNGCKSEMQILKNTSAVNTLKRKNASTC